MAGRGAIRQERGTPFRELEAGVEESAFFTTQPRPALLALSHPIRILMHPRERIVNYYLAERLRRIRREQGIGITELAERVGLAFKTCQDKEAGRKPIGLDYLLRFGLVTGIPIQDLWFPVHERIECLDDEVIRSLLEGLSEKHRGITEEDVIEIAASVFQVPVHAITDGFQHRKAVRARNAAALVVRSHPLLTVARLARLVRRTPTGLRLARYHAAKYGPEFWRKVEALQQQIDEL